MITNGGRMKIAIHSAGRDVLGYRDKKKLNDWFNEECKAAVARRNTHEEELYEDLQEQNKKSITI